MQSRNPKRAANVVPDAWVPRKKIHLHLSGFNSSHLPWSCGRVCVVGGDQLSFPDYDGRVKDFVSGGAQPLQGFESWNSITRNPTKKPGGRIAGFLTGLLPGRSKSKQVD